MTTALYHFDNVTRKYGLIHAVDGISFTIGHPCALAVTGSNGSGKSTLLSLMASVIKPSAGRISFMNQPDIDKRRIGYVSHAVLLYNDLTVLQNLLFFASMYQVREAVSLIDKLIRQFRLENCRNRIVRGLSRGQQQRATLARALIHNPDVLILDEPFTGLDESNTAMLTGYLKSLHESGISIIFSTHDMSHARNLTEKVFILKNGKLAETPAVS